MTTIVRSSSAGAGSGSGSGFAPVTLTASGGVITPNAALGYGPHRYTATGNVTLGAPNGGTNGEPIEVQVTASGADRQLTIAGTATTIPSGSTWWGHLSYDSGLDRWHLDDPGAGTGVGGYTDEQVRDVVAATLVQGSNITITPNDATDTITISAASGGTGGIPAATVTAKGDLVGGTGSGTVARVPVGSDGLVLVASSAASTGLAYVNPNSLPLVTNVQTGTAYTLALADAGTVVEMNNAGAMTVTVPTNTAVAFPVGTVIELCRYGSGTLTVAAAVGVTLRNPSSLTARVQYSTISLRKRGSNEWIVAGDLT